MCINCDDYILNEAFALLEPLFEEYGRMQVVNAIHGWYHHGQNNVAQVTLWETWNTVGE